MVEFSSKLTGFDELEKALTQLPIKVEKNILQSAVRSALTEGRKEIVRAAPVAQDGEQSPASKKYGTIKKNIKIKSSKRDKKAGQRGGYITTSNAFWAWIYEVGNYIQSARQKSARSNNIEMGSRYQPARPWFTPAFTRAIPKMINKLAEKISGGIEKVWDEYIKK